MIHRICRTSDHVTLFESDGSVSCDFSQAFPQEARDGNHYYELIDGDYVYAINGLEPPWPTHT